MTSDRKLEMARNEGTTGPNRLDDTRCTTYMRSDAGEASVTIGDFGFVFQAHRVCVSLKSRLESNKEEEDFGLARNFSTSGRVIGGRKT